VNGAVKASTWRWPRLYPPVFHGSGGAEYRDVRLHAPKDLWFGLIRHGAYTNHGPVPIGPLITSARSRWSMMSTREPSGFVSSEVIEGSLIWGGVFHTVFGHFLTETLANLIMLRAEAERRPDARILFLVSPIGSADFKAKSFIIWFLARIGIDPKRFAMVETACEIEHLIIVRSAFTAKYRYRAETAPALDHHFAHMVQPNGKRLFLSRLNLTKPSRTQNEAEHQDLYEEQGFEVCRPEALSLEDQIATDVIAGVNGSALHWSLFSPVTRAVINIGWHLQLQQGICDLRGQRLIRALEPLTGRLRGRNRPISLSVSRRALRQLDERD
jgi:Glycosyltransferase 61